MRRLLYAVVVGAFAPAAAAQVPAPTQAQLDRACVAALVPKCPRLVIVDDHPGLAATNGYTITVSRKLLGIARSEAEVMSVLTHELGHVIAHSVGRLHPASPEAKELEADMLGTIILEKLGYRCDAGASLLARIQHPMSKARVAALRRACR